MFQVLGVLLEIIIVIISILIIILEKQFAQHILDPILVMRMILIMMGMILIMTHSVFSSLHSMRMKGLGYWHLHVVIDKM